jgi:hypothetical protein
MKIRLFTLCVALFLGFSLSGYAGIVEKSVAKKLATNYFYERLAEKSLVKLADVQVFNDFTIADNTGPLMYIFNFSEGGFMIVAADDVVNPVIGYVFEGMYTSQNQPENFMGYLDYMKGQVHYFRTEQIAADNAITSTWARYTDDNFASMPLVKSSKDIEPLTTSRWDQGKYYNTMTPVDAGGVSGHCVTGCVATSMAQILYYYRYPETGQGQHGYNANNPNGNPNYGVYGFQQANYGATTYHWDAMVNEPSEANLEIAQLMYHCAVGVNMGYGPQASGAYTADVPSAMINYFRMSSTTSFSQKFSYTTTQWDNLIQGDLNNKHPLIYSGQSSAGGHAWICDGFQIQSGSAMYHMNWGWSAAYNGYFTLSNLNPGGDPPYNGSQGIVKNMYPPNGYPSYCTGQKTVTSSTGSIEDGSGLYNYSDNANCSWLIAPADSVKKIILTFEKLDTESNNDIITVYDGDNTSAPVLLQTSGNTLPTAALTSTKNKVLVTFTSNGSVNAGGFFISYRSVYPQYCSGTNTFNAPQGTLADGSGSKNYVNNATCNWIIDVPFGFDLKLTFTAFDLEDNNDFVKVYDYATQTLLATYHGHTVPAPVVSPSGKMYIVFKSDYVYNFGGWEAQWSVGNLGLEDNTWIKSLSIYPNPVSDKLNIDMHLEEAQNAHLELASLSGQVVYSEEFKSLHGELQKQLDVTSFAKGVYVLKITGEKGVITRKVSLQ